MQAPQTKIAPAGLRLQGASRSQIVKISEQFENASPRFQDAAGIVRYELAHPVSARREDGPVSTLGWRNEMRTTRARWTIVALLPMLVLGTVAQADDFRSAMETANAQFLAAFNTPNPPAFLPLYTMDSILYFQGAAPVTGPEAIKQFWESRIKLGVRDHTFDVTEAGADGKYAYQVTRTTVQLVRDSGEKTLIAGHTVRIFEKQSDGTWKIKIHMYNRPGAP